MPKSCGRDRTPVEAVLRPTTRGRALVAVVALLATLALGLAVNISPAAAHSGAEGSEPRSMVGSHELSDEWTLVDPHEVADRGLLRALANAGLLDLYLERASTHESTTLLKVLEPSDGYTQTRQALLRAAARHRNAVIQAELATASFQLANTPAYQATELGVTRRGHGSALQAAASAGEVRTLIDYLHAYRRAEQLAGVELQTVVFDAYLLGEQATADRDGCDVRWTTFAAIGFNESRHGTLHNATVDIWGNPSRTLLGPLLDGGASSDQEGNGFAVVRDSDRGLYDGNYRWDRAIGPMQFLPSTWMTWSADGNGDGAEDPQNMYDAVAGAANLLCGLIEERGYDPHRYLLGYNGSGSYVRKVLRDGVGFEALFVPELHRSGTEAPLVGVGGWD